MRAPQTLYSVALATLLASCGGSRAGASRPTGSAFASAYPETFIERTPIGHGANGTPTLTISRDGKLTGTTTDSRHNGAGWIATGSAIAADGTVTVVATDAEAGGMQTTTQAGTFEKNASGNLSGSLTERERDLGGPTFGYAFPRTSPN